MKSLIECPNCHKMLTANLAACPKCGWLVAAQEADPVSVPEPESAPEPVREEAAAPADIPASPNTVGEYHVERAEGSTAAKRSRSSKKELADSLRVGMVKKTRRSLPVRLIKIAVWLLRVVLAAAVIVWIGYFVIEGSFLTPAGVIHDLFWAVVSVAVIIAIIIILKKRLKKIR